MDIILTQLHHSRMTLPEIEYNEKRPASWYSMKCDKAKNECAERLAEILMGDSWAVYVSGTQLFDKYENKSPRDVIFDSIIRDKITRHPFCMLNDIMTKSANGRIDIYLGGDIPWFVVCWYNYDTDICVIEYYKSQVYIDKENDEKRIAEFQ